MALKQCPHMTSRCPHYVDECSAPASEDCHYIQRNTADRARTIAILQAVSTDRLSPEMLQYLHQEKAFLKEMEMRRRMPE